MRGTNLDILLKQLDNFFIISLEENKLIKDNYDKVMNKIKNCFSKINNKYYFNPSKKEIIFNPYHSGHWCSFLYFYSNLIYKKNSVLADKIYYLNKIMNSIDLFYEVELPKSYFFEHPVGTVIGRAKFNGKIAVLQNCTIGNNKGNYPEFGDRVILYSGVTVIGKSKIGDNVVLSANTYVKDENIPSNTIVFGASPNLVFKENKSINSIFK